MPTRCTHHTSLAQDQQENPKPEKVGITAVEHQIRLNSMHRHPNTTTSNNIAHPKQTTLTSLTAKCPHPSATLLTLKLNMPRFRKPD
jgi:hypothetical protein